MGKTLILFSLVAQYIIIILEMKLENTEFAVNFFLYDNCAKNQVWGKNFSYHFKT